MMQRTVIGLAREGLIMVPESDTTALHASLGDVAVQSMVGLKVGGNADLHRPSVMYREPLV